MLSPADVSSSFVDIICQFWYLHNNLKRAMQNKLFSISYFQLKCADQYRYDVGQNNMLLHMLLQTVRQNINQSLKSQRTPHIYPHSH